MGMTSTPAPGAHAVSQGVLEIWVSRWCAPPPVVVAAVLTGGESGRADSPKQVHPFPPLSSARAVAARLGGIRNRMAWWTSMLFGTQLAETMNEFLVMCGFTSVQ